AICRGVTRTAAKNFFYAFLVMPKEKRNALCAVYAFMRHADDLSDDATQPADQRWQKLEDWRQQFHLAMQGHPTDDPVLFPLAERTGIAFQLTNIIRDVREDALLGRVYLPEEDLARFGRSAAELAPAAFLTKNGNGSQAAVWVDILRFEADRAREFYRAADE